MTRKFHMMHKGYSIPFKIDIVTKNVYGYLQLDDDLVHIECSNLIDFEREFKSLVENHITKQTAVEQSTRQVS